MDFKIIKQHLLSRTGNVWHQLLRNSLVGGFTLGCDLFILFILVDVFHCQKIIATVISSIVGGIISFAISSRWVFNQRRFNNVPLESWEKIITDKLNSNNVV